MKKKAVSKEKAAQALALLAEEHLKTYPVEERDGRIRAFGIKVLELKKKRAKSSKPRATSRGRRQTLARG
jgi:hypothetical protein